MHRIIIQHATQKDVVPTDRLLYRFAKEALNCPMAAITRKNKTQTNTLHLSKEFLKPRNNAREVTIRIVDKKEMAKLNFAYRHKKGATNVLSFPCGLPEGLKLKRQLLGDVVACAEIINKEAKKQKKVMQAHWAHIIIHGILHLLGYNHEKKQEAILMESLEIELLHRFKFANPYQDSEN